MEIEYSNHAKDQIKRRRISSKRVIETINAERRVTSFKNRKVYQKTYGQKTLEVVTIRENDKLVIITAYYFYENKLRS